MRGKLIQAIVDALPQRITPADAGKTRALKLLFCNNRDHPRGCGENNLAKVIQIINIGSPPRMRGKHVYWLNPVTRERITPADAGKTVICGSNTKRQKDHPRGCGENACAA